MNEFAAKIGAAVTGLSKAALAHAHGHRPEALALAARQINKAAKALSPVNPRLLPALPPVADGPADEVKTTGGE